MQTYKILNHFSSDDPWYIRIRRSNAGAVKLLEDTNLPKVGMTVSGFRYINQLVRFDSFDGDDVEQMNKRDFLMIVQILDQCTTYHKRRDGIIKWLLALFAKEKGIHVDDFETDTKLKMGVLIAHLMWTVLLDDDLLIHKVDQDAYSYSYTVWPCGYYCYNYYTATAYAYYYTKTKLKLKGQFAQRKSVASIRSLEAMSIYNALAAFHTQFSVDIMKELNDFLSTTIPPLPATEMLEATKSINSNLVKLAKDYDDTKESFREIKTLIAGTNFDQAKLQDSIKQASVILTSGLSEGKKKIRAEIDKQTLVTDGRNGSPLDFLSQNAVLVSTTMVQQGKWIYKAFGSDFKTCFQKNKPCPFKVAVKPTTLMNGIWSGFVVGFLASKVVKKVFTDPESKESFKNDDAIIKPKKVVTSPNDRFGLTDDDDDDNIIDVDYDINDEKGDQYE